MEGIQRDSRTARILGEALGDGRFTLIDVGCSGGLDEGWRVFGDRLRAFGFDPSVHEIDRLTQAETRPEVRYVNAFVSLPDGHPLKGGAADAWRTDPWRRVSASHTQALQIAREAAQPPPAGDPEPEPASEPSPPPSAPPQTEAPADQDLMLRNLWRNATLGGGSVHLPDFLAGAGVDDIDFVKIDIDGEDFEVLRSLEGAPGTDRLLGVCVEVGYSGVGDPNEHSFHNVDRFMRSQGFDLFDLTVRRYALATLPSPFIFPHPIAAQTTRGRPLIGDALYLRDFGHEVRHDPDQWTDDKLIKLAALYCLFGLPDHAAELMDLFGDRLAPRLDVAAVRESLTAEIQDMDADLQAGFPRFSSYADYRDAYERDADYFYGADERRHRRLHDSLVQRDAALAALAAAQAEHRQALEAAHATVVAYVREQSALRQTLSWRITAPLRGLRRLLRPRA